MNETNLSSLIDKFKKCVVFIGKNDDELIGTGFFIQRKYKRNLFNCLITAKHVLFDENDVLNTDLIFYIKTKGSRELFRLHVDKLVDMDDMDFKCVAFLDHDIAAMFVPPHLKITSEGKSKEIELDIESIEENHLATFDEVLELQDVFFVAYQPGISDIKRLNPIFRHGTISNVDIENESFIIDGFAYPGNSGSPIFFKTKHFGFDESGKNKRVKYYREKLIGLIINSYVNNSNSDEFQENTGLSTAVSSNKIKEILHTMEFEKELEKAYSLVHKQR